MSAGLASKSNSSRTGRFLVTGAVLLAILTVGLLLAETRQNDAAETLAIPDDALDFGTAWAQSGFKWTVPVENRGDRTVVVEHVLASCGCTEVTPTSFRLAPGATRELTLLLDFVPESRQIGTHLSPFEVGLDFRDGEGHRLGFWTLRGKVRYPFVGTADIAWFGPDELIENVPSIEKQCKLSHRYSVASVAVGKHDFPGDVRTETDGVGRSTRVSVIPAGDLPTGGFEYEIPLVAVLSDGTRLPPIPLRVRGRVNGEVTTVPGTLRLPPARVGETVRMTVQVQSRSGRPFRVTKAAVLSDAATLTLLDATQSGGPLYEVTKTIIESGSATENIQFVYVRDDGSGGSITAVAHSYGLTDETSP
ncbi:MAG: DUF1573 domain-containing protein [Planctomycetaceae bacterium]